MNSILTRVLTRIPLTFKRNLTVRLLFSLQATNKGVHYKCISITQCHIFHSYSMSVLVAIKDKKMNSTTMNLIIPSH